MAVNIHDVSAARGATQIIQIKSEGLLQPSFFKTSDYERHKNINPKRVDKTCLWFLGHSTFQKWKDSERDDLLLLSADPGCGKSVLSRALIDDSLISAKHSTLCYFFFKDNEEQNNVATALCAILHQLLCARKELLSKHIIPAYEEHGAALLKKSEKKLWLTFLSAATDTAAGNVICILDALDECRESDRKNLVSYLEEFFENAGSRLERKFQLKFLVTSRPYSHIESSFSILTENNSAIRLSGELESGDISREIGIVMEAKIEEIGKRHGLKDDLKSLLKEELRNIPNRTYLWQYLMLEEVNSRVPEGKTKKNLRSIINRISRTVEDAYEAILARSPNPEKARKILQIIVGAQRPLTLKEIDVALAIEPDSTTYDNLELEKDEREHSIRHICGLFVNVVDSRVYLIHQTAREFLIQKDNAPSTNQEWRHSISLQKAHEMLAEKCVTYLHFQDLRLQWDSTIQENFGFHHERRAGDGTLLFYNGGYGVNRWFSERYPFLNYSASHWILHLQESGIVNKDLTSKTVEVCDIGDGSSCIWFSIYMESNNEPSNNEPLLFDDLTHSALYWAIVLGLRNEAEHLLAVPVEGLDSTEDFLEQAIGNGRHGTDLVRLVLERRREEVKITEKVVRAVLANEHPQTIKEIIQLLFVYCDADIRIVQDILVEAAGYRHHRKEVINLLLDRYGENQVTEEVMIEAAGNLSNGKNVMTLLLDCSPSIQITEDVMFVSAGNNYQGHGIMSLLLERYEDIQITEDVVVRAAHNVRCGIRIMSLLLDRRSSDIQITQKIVKAAARNHIQGKEIVSLLLDRRGSDIQITPKIVKAAAKNHNIGKEIVSLLLRRRSSEIQITEDVVVGAAYNAFHGNEIITLLLNGCSTDVPITQEVAVSIARMFDQDVVKLLLDLCGPNVQITEDFFAAIEKNLQYGRDILEFLFEHRRDDIMKFVPIDEMRRRLRYRSQYEWIYCRKESMGDFMKPDFIRQGASSFAEKGTRHVITLLAGLKMPDLEVFSAVSAASNLLEAAINVVERVPRANKQQKDLVRAFSTHHEELVETQKIVHLVDHEKALRTAVITSQLNRTKGLTAGLVDCLEPLDPENKGSMRQFAHQLIRGSHDKNLIANRTNKLGRAKPSPILRIQVANVDLTRITGDTLVANTATIHRVDELLREIFGEGRGLKTAGFSRNQPVESDGMVALSEDDLVCFNSEVAINSDTKTSPKQDGSKSTVRIVVKDLTKEQALQINGPVGEKGWREVSRLEIRSNTADGRSVQLNHGISPDAFERLLAARL